MVMEYLLVVVKLPPLAKNNYLNSFCACLANCQEIWLSPHQMLWTSSLTGRWLPDSKVSKGQTSLTTTTTPGREECALKAELLVLEFNVTICHRVARVVTDPARYDSGHENITLNPWIPHTRDYAISHVKFGDFLKLKTKGVQGIQFVGRNCIWRWILGSLIHPHKFWEKPKGWLRTWISLITNEMLQSKVTVQ